MSNRTFVEGSIKGKNKKVTQQEHTKAEEDMDQRFL